MPHDLIIFDCDGVLVDSEVLGTSVLVEMVAELGAVIPLDEAVSLFRGVKMIECVELIERRLGSTVPPTFIADFRARCVPVFASRLRSVEGIEMVLDHLREPYCVASSSPIEKIALMLGLTNLLPRFEGRIFSAYDVGTWKPDPGLFLYTAARMGVRPAACVVIEDSLVGVQAAVAAGMTTFGFADTTYADVLAAAGATVFHAMSDLPGLLAMHARRAVVSPIARAPALPI